jgi:prepilin peptidase CpaA
MHDLNHDLIYGTAFTIVGFIGGICDARKLHNIPNWLTFPAMLAGVITHGVLDGEKGLVSAGIALGLMFLIMLPIILRRGMGMGDLKLLLATSAFAGTERFLWVLSFSALVALVLGSAVAVYSGYFRASLRNVFALFRHMRYKPLSPHPELNIDNPDVPKFPFGIAVALGCLITVLYSGVIA